MMGISTWPRRVEEAPCCHGLRYRLKYHGTGGRAANEMRQVTAEIGKYALSKGKSIVKEELSFIKEVPDREKGSGRRYNKMLHTTGLFEVMRTI